MKNFSRFLRRLGAGISILACAACATPAHQGKPLADPIVGLTAPDFYNRYLEQATDAGLVQLRR